LFEVLVISNAN